MYPTVLARTRSATSTCTKARVEAVLDVFLGDVCGFVARGLVPKERALNWHRDLVAVLVLEAVKRFQLTLTLPDGSERALDYEVSDDGRISGEHECGGFATHWTPVGTRIRLVVEWRQNAPALAEAHRLLMSRGWGPGTMLDATGLPDRSYSRDGYGFNRRIVGAWPL